MIVLVVVTVVAEVVVIVFVVVVGIELHNCQVTADLLLSPVITCNVDGMNEVTVVWPKFKAPVSRSKVAVLSRKV